MDPRALQRGQEFAMPNPLKELSPMERVIENLTNQVTRLEGVTERVFNSIALPMPSIPEPNQGKVPADSRCTPRDFIVSEIERIETCCQILSEVVERVTNELGDMKLLK